MKVTAAARCPACGSEEVERTMRSPLGKALSVVNPLAPFRCLSCDATFWRPRPAREAVAATAGAVLVVALAANLLLQVLLAALGFSYADFDRGALFAGVPPGLRCSHCGSSEISRSVPQPLDRAIAPLSPWEPYRCWSCWKRQWELKSTVSLLGSLLVDLILLALATRALLHYRARRDRLRRMVRSVGDADSFRQGFM